MRAVEQLYASDLNPFTPSSKRTFSHPFKEKCISEVARIHGSIFHLSKQLWKAKFFILCDVVFLVRLQENFGPWFTLGSERVKIESVLKVSPGVSISFTQAR